MTDLVIRHGTLVDGTGAEPRQADVAIRDGRITDIAETIEADASETIDASGKLVTPGFVDAHTHYDGQVTWDEVLAPSSWHGITSVVMGNCGVGFAPVHPDRKQWLIELMEGVEDIPGSALSEGISWGWESFPEYLDVVAQKPRAVEVAAQIAHGALRAYVMGERGANNEPATPAEVDTMAGLVREAIDAGAVAFSTNRLPLHTSLHGVPVPGTFADWDELLALTRPMGEAGQGILQSVPAGAMGEDPEAPLREIELYRRLSLETGVTINFSLAQINRYPDLWRDVLAAVESANDEGAKIVPQVQGRPAGLLMSWETFNPFSSTAAYAEVAALPLAERLEHLREPTLRDAILAEVDPHGPATSLLTDSMDTTFLLDEGPVFEPDPDLSIAARAERAGVDLYPFIYDLMIERAGDAGQPGWLHVLFAGYKGGSLGDLEEMLMRPYTITGLSDGGAHCSMICDASLPTFMLEHWARDRTRGERMSLPEVIKQLSKDPADLYSLGDRGTVERGKRADLNVIDFEGLEMQLPELVRDLPTGAPRVVQRARGYTATLCAGEVTFREGEPTGATPGGLIRGPQSV
jgi:N-acyl-D-aspartate/D-glutamate deacylase